MSPIRATTIQQHRCSHPLFRFPNPLPRDGERCPICGAVYAAPNPLLREAQQTLEGRRDVEDLRALCEFTAYRLMADDKELTATDAARERQRLCRRRGWLQEEETADATPAIAS